MKNLFPTICLALLVSCSAVPSHTRYRMLVGTYTQGSASQGVYLYDFDSSTGETALLDTAQAGNPSFVVPSSDGTRAYCVCEFGDGTQGVASFVMEGGSIEALNFQPGCGADPCNIIIAGGSVLTSDYSGGSLSSFPLLSDGSIGPMEFSFTPSCEYDAPASHIHCAVPSPDGKYVFITDLGRDAVYRACPLASCYTESCGAPSDFVTAYQFDRKMHPGPRHMVFSPDGKFAYLLGETGDCLSVFRYSDGRLTHISTEKAYDAGGNGSADIHITPDGRFLYTSHRLISDGIAIFRRNPSKGTLTRAGYCPTGLHPRNFAITPDGTLLLCACRDSDRIEIYSIDRRTGMLTPTGKVIQVPSPVCIRLFR